MRKTPILAIVTLSIVSIIFISGCNSSGDSSLRTDTVEEENDMMQKCGVTIEGDKAIIDGNIIGGQVRAEIASVLDKLGYKVILKLDNLTYW